MGGTVADGVADGLEVRVGFGVGDIVRVGLIVGSVETEGFGVSTNRVGITAVGGNVGNGAKYSSIMVQLTRLNIRNAMKMIFLCMADFSETSIFKALSYRVCGVSGSILRIFLINRYLKISFDFSVSQSIFRANP